MNRLLRLGLTDLASMRQARLARRRRSIHLRPLLEGLEDRTLLSTITWDNTNFPTGGDWDATASWVGGKVPGQSDDAVINLTSAGQVKLTSGNADSVASVTTNGNSTLRVLSGSLSLGVDSTTFGGPVEVGNGGTLSIGNNANVQINPGQTIVVDSGGAMTVGAATVEVVNSGGSTQGITVAGTLTATGTNFTTFYGTGVGGSSRLTALSGGHLTATNTNFAWDTFNLNDGSVLNSGDLTNNTFIQTTVSVPGTDVPLLAGPDLKANKSFADVDIITGNLSSGALTLGLMGSASTAKLRYVFVGPYEVKSGATLSVADNVNMQINPGQTIAVDSGGAMTVGAATVEVVNSGGSTQGSRWRGL
jgi:putative surface-exposed virulence protein